MNDRFRSVPRWAGHELPAAERLSREKELRHFSSVSSSLLRGALDRWAELWGELQGQITCGVMVLPEAQRGFKPRCGWPEFLEKMWALKHYLDYAKRYCEGRE